MDDSDQSMAMTSTMSSPAPGSTQPTSTPIAAPPIAAPEVPPTDSNATAREPDVADVKGKKKTKGGKKKSSVWDHFERVDEDWATCNYCHNPFAAHVVRNGTSGMKNHLERCPDNPNKLKKGQTTLSFPPPRPGDSGKLVAASYSYDNCRRALVEFIIKEEMSFRMVESEGFKSFCHVLEPIFKVPGRMTIYRDLLVIYKEEKENLKSYFKESKQRVSLTTDTWTAQHTRFNYMCVTVHYIDRNWMLKKRIIMFCQIKSHTGDNIGRMLEKCLLSWGLQDVFGVTLDNASANGCAMNYLKYLMEEREPKSPNFDILEWWKANREKYKVLSCMAKDILSMPVSSVASEAAFSTGKRILTPWRSSLSPRTVEALLCTQSWLKQPIALDLLTEFVSDDCSSIEEELLGQEPEVLDD